MSKRPCCYGCDKRARKLSAFCTNKCAAEYCDELVSGNEQSYCPKCDDWTTIYEDGRCACGCYTVSPVTIHDQVFGTKEESTQ